VRTFNIGFEEHAFDEGVLAETTARMWCTHHERLVVSQAEVLSDLPAALAGMDQPTIDGVNTWYVARAAKRAGVTVALSGLGGDELFAGYDLFHWLPFAMRAAAIVAPLPRVVRANGAALAPVIGGAGRRGDRLAALLAADPPFEHPYLSARLWFTPAQRRALLRAAPILAELEPWYAWVRRCVEQARTYDAVGAISYLEATQYMLSRLLRDTDAMSMAHSLEVRVPLLDHVLAEHAIRVPGRFKLSRDTHKPLMVRSLDGMLPRTVLGSPKRTFTFPWVRWLRADLQSEVQAILTAWDGSVADVLDRRAVRATWEAFMRGTTTWSRPWGLYVLHQWCAQHLKGG
jgi:asparagine synthase (glutamine-hydrolysing)